MRSRLQCHGRVSIYGVQWFPNWCWLVLNSGLVFMVFAALYFCRMRFHRSGVAGASAAWMTVTAKKRELPCMSMVFAAIQHMACAHLSQAVHGFTMQIQILGFRFGLDSILNEERSDSQTVWFRFGLDSILIQFLNEEGARSWAVWFSDCRIVRFSDIQILRFSKSDFQKVRSANSRSFKIQILKFSN